MSRLSIIADNYDLAIFRPEYILSEFSRMKIPQNKHTNQYKHTNKTKTFHEDIPNCDQIMEIQELLERKKSRGHNLKSNKRGNNDASTPQIIFN